ncbi:response regulator transcription factor [Sphingopyxis sp.]|uniref:response regulator transcription factor n=1 Tax=Sphingopyxis sp. TaxID=1908224 RepID=UPI002D776910|nr:response regulator transcription factor [Sphingopyxis sp.]HET6523566.1 response regulator transcription factor [Sphingopyxis sp.]
MRIAILEDDLAQAGYVKKFLLEAGHGCDHFADGQDLIRALRRETFDLLVLDWNVPGASGLDVLQWMKINLETPPAALMLTSRSTEEDIVEGLLAGADDYVVKPVSAPVLLARVDAIARRAHPHSVSGTETFGRYRFDTRGEQLEIDGEPVNLTAKEFALALLLFRNTHRALSRAYIFESLWGRSPDLPTRTLDVHISNVRTKLNLRPSNGYKLVPVYAYGYRLEALE